MSSGPRARIEELFAERYGGPPERVARVSADGSARRYWRLVATDGRTAIGAYGPDAEENRAFLSFSRAFRGIGLPVPEIQAADEEAGVWLAEDLGDRTLFDVLTAAREGQGVGADGFPAAVLPLYRRVLEILPRFQVEGARAVDFRAAYPRPAFDRQSVLWDLNYFKYHFLKLAGIPFSEARLERDFGRLARFLLKAPSDFFLYRDFQSRNVMVRDGEPWFIDYQGGRRGALQYDPASLLYDAKADIPGALRQELLDHYLDALGGHAEVDRGEFRQRYPGFVLVRLLQAMGAYGYRGFYERKTHFLQSVPYAARTLGRLVEEGLPLRAPELEAVLRRIARAWAERDPDLWAEWPELAWGPRPATARPPAATGAEAPPIGLTVHVGSFSYRGGYPADPTGHGGGFVFDCRAVPNPGREEAHRAATGLDPEVAAWLGSRPETAAFWEGAVRLVEAQVERFLGRRFTDLTVHFGCTGGQHRSPYFAERLARHLRERYPGIEAEVVHREREAWPAPDDKARRGPGEG